MEYRNVKTFLGLLCSTHAMFWFMEPVLCFAYVYDDRFRVRASASFRAHHVAAFEGMLVSGLCDSLCKRIGVSSEIRLTLLLATFFLTSVAARKKRGAYELEWNDGTW